MNTDHLYNISLAFLVQSFEVLSQRVGTPSRERIGGGYAYRYKDKTIYQAIVQKLARAVTGLHAIRLLNKAGLLQEQAALQRTLDEFEEDIAFLCFGVIFQDITDLHGEYLSAFYEEELDKPESAIKSSQKRPMIPRKKIRAFVSKYHGPGYDQSSAIEASRTISKVYSGYVHAASPHLMELCYGNPPGFHLWGGTDSPLYEDHVGDLLNYHYRAILSFTFAAKALNDEPLCKKLHQFSGEFAVASGREGQLREAKI